jgi:hypothetical protein
MNQAANSTVRPVIFALVAVLILAGATAYADVKLPAIIGDNMVLQQGVKAPIWGWADPPAIGVRSVAPDDHQGK